MKERKSKSQSAMGRADPARQRAVEEIARRHLVIETLVLRRRDALDFRLVAVWAVEAALVAAYDAGRASVRGEH